MASVLKLKIDISDEDLAEQFTDFQNCYPEGKINEEEFLEIFSNNIVFSPNSLFRYLFILALKHELNYDKLVD